MRGWIVSFWILAMLVAFNLGRIATALEKLANR